MQQTSLISYQNLRENLRNQTYQGILAILSRWPEGLTDREIASIMGYSDPNHIGPRRNELVKRGFLAENGKKIWKISHFMAKNTPPKYKLW